MILPPHEPDFFEKCVRFVCGLIFGFLGGVYTAFKFFEHTGLGFWLVTAGITLSAAVLAVRYGDEFWKAIIHPRGW